LNIILHKKIVLLNDHNSLFSIHNSFSGAPIYKHFVYCWGRALGLVGNKKYSVTKISIVVKKIIITRKGIEKSYYESVRAYTKEELLSFFNNNGLKVECIYGNYLGNNFEEESSPRIIIIAQK